MTKQEFISRQKAMTQYANKRLTGWLILFFGVLIGNIPLTRYVETHERLAWAGPLFGVGLFVFLIGNLCLLAWFSKGQQKRLGLSCPSCGKAVMGVRAQIAIASGNCGNCGEKVFSE
jgi:hypothetical protein